MGLVCSNLEFEYSPFRDIQVNKFDNVFFRDDPLLCGYDILGGLTVIGVRVVSFRFLGVPPRSTPTLKTLATLAEAAPNDVFFAGISTLLALDVCYSALRGI